MTFIKIWFADQIAEDLNNYIDSVDAPMIEEFCLPRERPSIDTVYRLAKQVDDQDPEIANSAKLLSEAIKRCHNKNVLHLERGVEAGTIPAGWAAFKRKQQCYGGWTDRQTIDQTVEHKGIDVNIKIVD